MISKPLRLVHPEMFKVFLEWGMNESARYWDLVAQQGEETYAGKSRCT
jgi:hypothetical protein